MPLAHHPLLAGLNVQLKARAVGLEAQDYLNDKVPETVEEASYRDIPVNLYELQRFCSEGAFELGSAAAAGKLLGGWLADRFGGKKVIQVSVKDAIKEVFEKENGTKPYSDQEIVAILKERGIEIARRTVAKYREQMKKYYYDPTKYSTYLEQLGITYPTVRTSPPPVAQWQS